MVVDYSSVVVVVVDSTVVVVLVDDCSVRFQCGC